MIFDDVADFGFADHMQIALLESVCIERELKKKIVSNCRPTLLQCRINQNMELMNKGVLKFTDFSLLTSVINMNHSR